MSQRSSAISDHREPLSSIESVTEYIIEYAKMWKLFVSMIPNAGLLDLIQSCDKTLLFNLISFVHLIAKEFLPEAHKAFCLSLDLVRLMASVKGLAKQIFTEKCSMALKNAAGLIIQFPNEHI